MNAPFRILLLLCVCPWWFLGDFASAQAPAPAAAPGYGFFRWVNATGLEGNVSFLVNNQDLGPGGFPSGFATGSIGYPPGVYQLTAKYQTLQASNTLVLKTAENKALVVYKEKPATSKFAGDNAPPKPTLHFMALDRVAPETGGEHSVTFLFVGNDPKMDLQVGSETITLERLVPLHMPVTSKHEKKHFKIMAGPVLLLALRFADTGDYAVIVYDKSDGTPGALSYYNTPDRGAQQP